MVKLDVIAPVKDRSTVVRCVSTLLEQAERAEGVEVGQLLLCDGGSRQLDCRTQLHDVAQLPAVRVLDRPHVSFNKGWLLNQGLEASTAPLVLISDVDILWPATTLSGLAAAQHPDLLYVVQSVQESQPNPSQRLRYAYRLEQTESETRVEIYPAPADLHRPGCGLVCGLRSQFHRIGGYRHDFQGWGWEDQDLLMRAQLLGYRIKELGTVTHLSHSDTQRNAFGPHTPQQSRDRNILICLQGLAQGKLLGDLSQKNTVPAPGSRPLPISIHYPSKLANAAHPDYALPRSPPAPD